MADIKPKLRVDVNHNPTKKGIKVQFVVPESIEGDAKTQMIQKLQAKLNQGLSISPNVIMRLNGSCLRWGERREVDINFIFSPINIRIFS